MKFEVSAPGKVILHGEHAVVYGKAAIAASLGLRTRLTLESQEEKLSLHLKDLGFTREWDKATWEEYFSQPLPGLEGSVTSVNDAIVDRIVSVFGLGECATDSHKHAVTAFLFLWIYTSKCYNNGEFHPCSIRVESELGLGAGMGSSASYSVCLAAGMLLLCGRSTPRLLPEDKLIIQEWSFQAEKIFHGKPSGLDNAVCVFGGAVLFKDGAVSEKVPNPPDIHVLIVNTRVSRNTKMQVEKAKQKMNLFPGVVGSIMDSIEHISNDCWSMLVGSSSEDSDERLQVLVDTNHHLLNALGVGHEKLDQVHSVAAKHSCVAKTTGAGGGGCALVYIPRTTASPVVVALKEDLKECGFDVHDAFLGGPGVQISWLA
ncbi:hypothetical protein JTE90_021245 [Oedothorax gibbosus]|uniref:Mevalonate kinase n=1 Tax=Oedothorax gibbosus TaxID=931172 RepID=A0AAV6UVT5_9ARAC|nr:hypothetical protein JTE90_021245 [Oedothorax gibbosus]